MIIHRLSIDYHTTNQIIYNTVPAGRSALQGWHAARLWNYFELALGSAGPEEWTVFSSIFVGTVFHTYIQHTYIHIHVYIYIYIIKKWYIIDIL